MRIFLTKVFARFAARERIDDAMLCNAVERAEKGLIDANLRGGVIKQRIARKGGGKSGGYRTIIIYRATDRAIFVYGFAKSERDNVSSRELAIYKDMARWMLNPSGVTISVAIEGGELKEVMTDG